MILLILLAVSQGRDMGYGPFLSSSVALKDSDAEESILADKAITVRVGEDAAFCFDADLLRAAGGWTGGFLNLEKTHHRSGKGTLPARIGGTPDFVTAKIPGWARNGSFDDPRKIRRGPLPRDWAHYKGLFLRGDRVVFMYTVGDCVVREMPGREGTAFTRTFRIEPCDDPMVLYAGEDVKATVIGAPAGVKVEGSDRVVVRIPPHPAAITFKLALGKGAGAEVEDLQSLSPSRLWKDEVVAAGGLGRGADPYVLDVVGLPMKNPWNSWIRLTGLDFFPDGRAAVCTWSGDVWVSSPLSKSLAKTAWRRFAAGLYEPLGLKVLNGAVHVTGRDQITRLEDRDGDGEADFYANVNNDAITWPNYHAFALGLDADAEGNLYYGRCGRRVPPEIPDHGCILKVPADGGRHEVVCKGLRAPNGISVTPGGRITTSDNQGEWIPSSKLILVRKGEYYGYPFHAGVEPPPKTFAPPLCWLPHKLDTSSGGQVWVTGDKWGPLKGQLLHTSYGTASLFQVVIDDAAEPAQAGVVPFPFTFSSGTMRARFHPVDGQLYVAGLRGWQSNTPRDAALTRVRYTGAPVHTVCGFHVTRGGVELTFTHPLDPKKAGQAERWAAEGWNYVWSSKYGSPDVSVKNPKRKERDELEIRSATVSADGRTVTLAIPEIRPMHQLLIRMGISAADGTRIRMDFTATINRVPE